MLIYRYRKIAALLREVEQSLVSYRFCFTVCVLTALAGGKTGRPIWISPFCLSRFFPALVRSSLSFYFSLVLYAPFLRLRLRASASFYSLPLAGLQVKRVTFYFLDDVLSLYLPLENVATRFRGIHPLAVELPPTGLHPPTRPK